MTKPPVDGAEPLGVVPDVIGGIANPASEGGVADPPVGIAGVDGADGFAARPAGAGLVEGVAVDELEPGMG